MVNVFCIRSLRFKQDDDRKVASCRRFSKKNGCDDDSLLNANYFAYVSIVFYALYDAYVLVRQIVVV